MLKVPVEERSKLTFRNEGYDPDLMNSANRALSTLRQFDGSGAFVPIRFPAENIDKFREVFGDKTPLEQNSDGSYSIPATLKVTKSADGRAHATFNGIALGGGRGLEEAVYHEVAHHIEMNSPGVSRAAVALREQLADKPREVYKLNATNSFLGEDEVAVRGKFHDPYAGKIYPHDVATEMISTGVQSYMSYPIQFARDNPEHFKLIFDVLHGKYRSR